MQSIFQEAVPLDCWMSNSCSATMIQESASRDEAELFSFNNQSLGELNMSAVHCTSGIIPTWSMSWSAGDTYFATVTKRADPSWSSVTLCIIRLGQNQCKISSNNYRDLWFNLDKGCWQGWKQVKQHQHEWLVRKSKDPQVFAFLNWELYQFEIRIHCFNELDLWEMLL